MSDSQSILIHLINDLLAGCKLRDIELVNYCRSRMKDLAPNSNGSLFLPFFQEIVDYIVEKDSEGEAEEKAGRMLALQCLKDIFGFESSLLADFYIMLSFTLTNLGRVSEAIEFCGRALLIRIQSHGLISEKTAESHFQLGSLYLRKGSSELARKEILAAMGVYHKIHQEDCLQITDCNILLGNIDLREGKTQSAYLSFYRAYRTRYCTLGSDNALTTAAMQLLIQCRTILSDDCFTAVELKDRAKELQWSEQDSKSYYHILAVYLTHLEDDLVLSKSQLQDIYHKTVRFYLEKLRVNFTVDDSNEVEERSQSKPSAEEALLLQVPTMEEVVSLLKVRAIIDVSSSSSSSSSSSGSSSMKKLTPVSSSGGSGNGKVEAKTAAPIANIVTVPAAAASVAVPQEESKDAVIRPSDKQIDVVAAEDVEDVVKEEPAFADRARRLSNDDGDRLSQSLPLPLSPSHNNNSSSKKNWKSIPIDSPLRRGGKSSIRTVTIPNLPLHSSQQSQPSQLCVVRDDHGDLLMIQHCSLDTLRKKLRARFVAFGLLAWIGHSYHSNLLENNDKDEIQESSEGERQSELEKWINRLKPPPPPAPVSTAIGKGLIVSLSSNNNSDGSNNGAGGTSTGGKGRRVSLIQQQLAATKRASIIAYHDPDHDDDLETADGNKGKAKNALNALFGRRSSLATSAAATPDISLAKGEAASGRRGDEARDAPNHKLPMPPPLPTHWPPIPYDPATTTIHPLDKAGEAAAGGSGEHGNTKATVDTRPKLKQIHLTSLANTEGTFWCEHENEMSLFKTDLLFSDLEEEFVIGGVKKPVMHGGGGNKGLMPGMGGMGALLSGITPRHGHALGGGSAAAVESALDAQRAQNINIMLAKFGKRSLDTLAETIINFEPTIAGSAAITSLQQFVPNQDEINKVRLFVEKKLALSSKSSDDRGGGSDTPLSLPPPSRDASILSGSLPLPPPSSPSPNKPSRTVDDLDGKALIDLKIGRAEQYIFIMGRIPHLDTRLAAMSQALSAQELMQFVVSSSDILINAVSEVKGSGRLKFILKAMLELNNALLRQSKGIANTASTVPMTGFALSAWSKAMQVKTNSGDTAQQYLVTKLLQHFPESLELAHDLPSIDEAKSLLLARMTASVKKLEETVTLLRDLLAQETAKNITASKAVNNLQTALQDAQRLYHDAKTRYDEAHTDFVALCVHFGESCPPSDPESFFGEIAALTRALTAATTQASSKNRRKAMAMVGAVAAGHGHGHGGGGHH